MINCLSNPLKEYKQFCKRLNQTEIQKINSKNVSYIMMILNIQEDYKYINEEEDKYSNEEEKYWKKNDLLSPKINHFFLNI